MAVDRLRNCDNIVELSEELGIHRRLLYKLPISWKRSMRGNMHW